MDGMKLTKKIAECLHQETKKNWKPFLDKQIL